MGVWMLRVLVLGVISVGVIVALDAVGALTSDAVGGMVGMGLGAASVVGATWWSA